MKEAGDPRDTPSRGGLLTRAGRAAHGLARALVRPFGRRDNLPAGWLFDATGGLYRTAGMRFEVPRHLTSRRFRGRFFLDAWERPEAALVERFVAPGATVLEVGGGLGVVAGHVQRRLADPRRHVVVEAHPELVPVLRRNRRRNGHAYAVEHGVLAPAAEEASGGDAVFHLHPLLVGGSTVRTTGRQVRVPALSYRELEARHRLTFDTLVLDVEGGEVDLLPELAGRPTLGRIVVELHPDVVGADGVAACRGALTAAGLRRLARRGQVEVWGRPAGSGARDGGRREGAG